MRGKVGPQWVDKGIYKEPLPDTDNVRVPRLEVDNDTTYLDKDGSNNLTFTDAVTGTKTLAELSTGGGISIIVAASNASAASKASAGATYTCDGTNDEVQIQAAIDAIVTTGGVVQLSEGLFNIHKSTGNDYTAMIIVKDNIWLRGTGYATYLKLPDAFNLDGNIVGNCDRTGADIIYHNARISRIRFDGNRANQSAGVQRGYISYHSHDCVIEDCYWENFRYVAINPFYCYDFIIKNNYVSGLHLTTGIYVDGTIDSIIEGNILRCEGGDSILLDDADNCVVSSNRIIGGSSGIELRGGCAANSIIGNTIQDGGDYGIRLGQAGYGNADLYNSVIGNTIQNCPVGIYLPWTAGIPSDFNTIESNIIQGCTTPLTDEGTNNTIRNNWGYIHHGESQMFSGSLTAGNTNAISFSWHNPYAQDAFVAEVEVEVTTVGGTAGSLIQVGIADDATGTNLGDEFLDGADLNTAGVYNSLNAIDSGNQSKNVLVQDSASATDGWVVGKIITQNAASLVGKYYIKLIGR